RALDALPSPLWGGVGGGGRAVCSQLASLSSHRATPLPTPPPQGGREQTEFAARAGSSNPSLLIRGFCSACAGRGACRPRPRRRGAAVAVGPALHRLSRHHRARPAVV